MHHEHHMNVQEVFLNWVHKNKTSMTVFLVNGVKLHGIVALFDETTILLKRDEQSQLIYKHAIPTLVPHGHAHLFEGVSCCAADDLSKESEQL